MSQPSSAEDLTGVSQESGPTAPSAPEPVEVALRRAPRYRPFVATGAVLGAALLLVGALVALHGHRFTTLMLPLDLVLVGALVGGLVGAAVALLLERRRPD